MLLFVAASIAAEPAISTVILATELAVGVTARV